MIRKIEGQRQLGVIIEEDESYESELPKYPFAQIIEDVKNQKEEVIIEDAPEKKVIVKRVVKKESEAGC